MQYVLYVAKALTAFLVALLAGLVAYNVDVNVWVLVIIAAVIEMLAVFFVPNGEKPTS